MAELFVQVEVSFPDSKLVAQAERQLGLNRDEAMGKLLRLWLAVMRAREGGDLSQRTDSWIEDAVGWRGEPGAFAAFVREHHTDDDGVIRDWQEKYGKLDKLREQYREKKRAQRGGAKRVPRDVPGRVPETVPETKRDVPRDVPGTVPRRVPPAVPQNASNNLSVSQSLSTSRETENSVDTARDPLDAILTEAKLDLAVFEGTDRAVAEGLLRSSSSPLSRAAVLANLLADFPPDLVGHGLREFLASEQPWGARHLRGFVERAERARRRDAERKTGRAALTREAQHIDTEAIEREREAREKAEADAMLADFERTHEAEYEQFKATAEAVVDSRVPKMMRAAAVRAKLLGLVRQALGNGGTDGAS